MSERKSLIKKLIYGAMIVVLWVPLSLMSQPRTKDSSGGALAVLRKQHKLSQAELGQIDPTSATMKLATMGLGGVDEEGARRDCRTEARESHETEVLPCSAGGRWGRPFAPDMSLS